jgi:probable rRNA maturation factor
MGIHVQFGEALSNTAGNPLLEVDILEKTATAVLNRLPPAQEHALTLVITGDQEVRDLNHQYLGIDEETDVLAFPAGEIDPDEEVLYLGDVIISYPRAVQQAMAAGHKVEAEIQLLVVHGILHLLGYDHLDPGDKTAMWSLQDEILTGLGCPARPA